jgi:AraC family transcriptional regulator
LSDEHGSQHTVEHHREVVARVIRAMREHPAVPLALGEMASLSFMSPFHFNRVFRLMTGIPPGLFQSALRFEAAKKLLLTTPMHLEEICERLGFLSPSTFGRQFKARVGLAPDRLRRLARMIQSAPFQIGDPLPALLTAPGDGGGLTGTVTAPAGFEGLVVVALFRKAAPEGWPAACAMQLGAGTFALPQMADGCYYLLSAGVDRRADIVACLIDGRPILRSKSRGLEIRVSQGKFEGFPDQGLQLRPADPLDPPILFAFPALMLEQLLGSDDTVRDASLMNPERNEEWRTKATPVSAGSSGTT